MTVRVVVAVAFTLALVAAAQPAVDHATRTRDAASLRASADSVVDATRALQRRSDPGESLATAPRRTLVLDVPPDAALAVSQQPPLLVSQLPSGVDRRQALPVPLVTCGDRPTLDGRVTLAYVEVGGDPVVLALRGFIREAATTPPHACTPGPVRDGRTGLRL